MRIAFTAPLKPPDWPTPSGDRTLARAFLSALRHAGHEVATPAPLRTFDRSGDPERQRRMQHLATRLGDRLIRRYEAGDQPPPDLWFTYHLYHKAPDWIGPRVARALGIPYVVVEASLSPKAAIGPWAQGHRAVEAALTEARLVLFLNKRDRTAIEGTYVPTKRCVDLPAIADLAPFLSAFRAWTAAGASDAHTRQAARKKIRAEFIHQSEAVKLNDETPLLITAAMMRDGDKLSSYQTLAVAMARLGARPWHLLIAGDGSARHDVEHAFSSHVNAGRVTFCGALQPSELAERMAASDLFVWPAHNEALGMAAVEAQAAGVPVVLGRDGDQASLMAENKTGFLVDGHDPQALANQIAQCLDATPHAREIRSLAAHDRAAKVHDIPAVADRLTELLNVARVPRVLIHVQHLLGVGHVRRAEALALALRNAGANVSIATGGFPVADAFADFDVCQLPPVRASDASFGALWDENDQEVDETWWQTRRAALLDFAETVDPDIILTEHFPFGRRPFRAEIIPLLERFGGRALTVASVRDVLVRKPPDKDRSAWAADLVERLYDAVIVHGDERVMPFADTFRSAERIAHKVQYSGFIANAPVTSNMSPLTWWGGATENPTGAKVIEDGTGEVIVSAGGGAVGAQLLDAALEARRSGCLSDRTWRFLVGRNMEPAAFERLRATALDRAIIEWARPDFRVLLGRAALSISQAGYNTMMDILVTRCRALVVPFETPSETEQRDRADRFAAKGLLHCLPSAELTPDSLANMAEAAAAPRLDGATRSAEIIAELWRGRLRERAQTVEGTTRS